VKRAIVALLLFVVACVAPAEEENVSSTAPLARTSTPWSVSRHVWPSADADLARDLDLVAELGARYVRTDVWWYSVEPERGKYDRAALDAYSRFFDEAKKRGLEVLVVLSNAPAWARALYERGAREAFFAAFGRYAFEVAKLAGSRVQNYQLWNEPNHVIDFVDGEGDIQLFVRGRAGIDAAVPGRTTMINLLVDGHDLPIGPSWMTDVDFYLQHGAGRAIDVIGIDHYPGTWAYGDWGGNILDRLGALGRRYGKAVAVLETGLEHDSVHDAVEQRSPAGEVDRRRAREHSHEDARARGIRRARGDAQLVQARGSGDERLLRSRRPLRCRAQRPLEEAGLRRASSGDRLVRALINQSLSLASWSPCFRSSVRNVSRSTPATVAAREMFRPVRCTRRSR
jgi:hypothetical protein